MTIVPGSFVINPNYIGASFRNLGQSISMDQAEAITIMMMILWIVLVVRSSASPAKLAGMNLE